MTDAIIVALISLIGTIITVVVSAKSTQDKVSNELATQNALQNNEINHIKNDIIEMKVDIKEHNHYGKLFSENIPVINEKLKVCEHRLSDLEKKL